ncbi:protein phosphatase 2C 32 [Phytophthora cinnamomi]|uniref:protein phosphatase 2C 32 n=1 Tax=Phytophthora cinnamomi TaxID=4785 RepID=UPI003559544F|nr:protein phosphatase 2C 32 [Phytophthora cinnamomi]
MESAPRLRRALTKVVEPRDVECGSDYDGENQEEQSSAQAASMSEDGADARSKKNGIRLLDVASLSVEGSQGHANEDRCVVASNERFHLLAVMDGHGGSWAGDFLVDKLFEAIDRVYDDGFDHAKLREALEELDRTFCAMATRKMDTSGACLLAVLLYVDPNTDTPQKIVLNIGDCRAIIREAPESVDSGKKPKGKATSTAAVKTVALSEDHCAGNVKERMRALRSGAYIQNNRIAGVLEPFRTIGDIDMKGPDMKNWVIPTPEIRQSELLVGRSILVIATDGVWSVLNNNRTMALVVKEFGGNGARPSAESAAQAIVNEAREFGSSDDVTVIVVSV